MWSAQFWFSTNPSQSTPEFEVEVWASQSRRCGWNRPRMERCSDGTKSGTDRDRLGRRSGTDRSGWNPRVLHRVNGPGSRIPHSLVAVVGSKLRFSPQTGRAFETGCSFCCSVRIVMGGAARVVAKSKNGVSGCSTATPESQAVNWHDDMI